MNQHGSKNIKRRNTLNEDITDTRSNSLKKAYPENKLTTKNVQECIANIRKRSKEISSPKNLST